MKKINNRYRNNNYNNQIYSLNYKFDSTSPAGKFNGTALDLIKRYNELAKDAFSNNDYVTAEVYRQYAEHYRKIVTDINEKKMQQRGTPVRDVQTSDIPLPAGIQEASSPDNDNHDILHDAPVSPAEIIAEAPVEKKEFTVIEVKENADASDSQPAAAPKKRVYRRRTTVAAAAVSEPAPAAEV